MKYYDSYMDRQEIPSEVHEKLLNLKGMRRTSDRRRVKYGALAACTALIAGVGVWKLAPQPQIQPEPAQSAGQFAADYTPLPGEKDVVEPDDLFVVNSPVEEGTMAFYYMPGIYFQDITDRPMADASRAYAPGTFMADLRKEDIQKIFWGPEGIPETYQTEIGRQDLPWALFWDGYTVYGRAWYDGQGQLTELTIYGDQGQAGFTLEMCLGSLPFSCCIDLSRGDEISDVSGVEVAGWSRAYDLGGQPVYTCGSEFMTESGVGVRFVNRNCGRGEDKLDGECWFNTLFVRQALPDGLYLGHLMTMESVPAWREESFSTLEQARQEADFSPYLPAKAPAASYSEFNGNLSYREGTENRLFVRWSKGYDDVEVCIYRDGYHDCNLVDPARPETYDLRLYSIPWCDSVPEEYRNTVNCPAFKAEDMSLSVVEARSCEKDTGGSSFHFEVLHDTGVVVSYSCDGMTARQVWKLVEETL